MNIKRQLMTDERWKNYSSLGTASMIDYPITSGHPSECTDMRNTKFFSEVVSYTCIHTYEYAFMNMFYLYIFW